MAALVLFSWRSPHDAVVFSFLRSAPGAEADQPASKKSRTDPNAADSDSTRDKVIYCSFGSLNLEKNHHDRFFDFLRCQSIDLIVVRKNEMSLVDTRRVFEQAAAGGIALFVGSRNEGPSH